MASLSPSSPPSSVSSPFIFNPAYSSHLDLIPSLVALHVASVESDNALMRFHPPFNGPKREKMRRFWESRVEEVRKGARMMFLVTAVTTATITALNSGHDEERKEEKTDVVGVVELGLPEAETGPFRAEVEMLMVHPAYRVGGLGRKLMVALEVEARRRGRTLLQLSTIKDSVADLYVYPRMGYVKFGVVPDYGITPSDGKLVDGVFMYKNLRNSPALQ